VPLPEQFGRYRILRPLGRGGMGTVYLALDAQLGRQVALKVPRFAADDDPQVLARFYREARAAARLQHPNLCPVYDVGQLNDVHYLTMAYVEGRPLSALTAADQLLPPHQAALLVRQIALAMEEAHAHGVVHRDLKPSNVLINKRGEPVVMDFGLARRPAADEERLTRPGALLGTPAYMAPEQVYGDGDAIGPACDIYSLSVLLYELLTGRPPFEGSLGEIMVKVYQEEPPPPSAHRPGLDSRLEAICLKGMAKKVEDRYGSMTELAQALGQYLQAVGAPAADLPGPPLAAPTRRAGPAPRRRRGWLVLCGSGAALAAVTALVLLAVWWPGRAVTPTGPGRPTDRELAASSATDAEKSPRDTAADGGKPRPDPRSSAKETPGPEVKPRAPAIFKGHGKAVNAVAFAPGGRLALSGGDDSTLRLWDLQDGHEVRRFLGHEKAVKSVAFSPDGTRIVSASEDGTARVWDAEKGDELQSFGGHGEAVSSAVFSPDGRRCLSGGSDGMLRLWDPVNGKEERHFEGHDQPVWAVTFSADGLRALSGGGDGTLRLWKVEDGSQVRRIETGADAVLAVALSADGRHAFSAGADGAVRMWDLETSREVRAFKGHSEAALALALSPDGRRLLSGGEDGTVRLWEVAGGEPHPFDGHAGAGKGVAFSPDGRTALSGGDDRTVRPWQLTPAP
jgi:hypothetical protein